MHNSKHGNLQDEHKKRHRKPITIKSPAHFMFVMIVIVTVVNFWILGAGAAHDVI